MKGFENSALPVQSFLLLMARSQSRKVSQSRLLQRSLAEMENSPTSKKGKKQSVDPDAKKNHTMQLQYRGIQYQSDTSLIATIASDEMGKYRGRTIQIQRPIALLGCQRLVDLKYRGLHYQVLAGGPASESKA